MFGLSNSQIGCLVVGILIVLMIYRSHQKQRKRYAYARKSEVLREAEAREMNEFILNVNRRKLRESREAHLSSVRRKNALHLQNGGVVWTDEAKAMLEYDRQHYDEWMAVGMTPPSFGKK
ncbi:MAG: hypothetical protein IJN54_17030 [Lachnospiraceae bacterium]|nr:hypothetical protein [Lachnospiraceae bacterium]